MPSHGLPQCALSAATTSSASSTTGRRYTNSCATENTSFLRLEAEVLQRLGGAAIQGRRTPFVSALRREISLGDPRGRAMRRRRQLGEGVFRLDEGGVRLVEPALLEQRAAEDEPGVADFVDHVLAVADQLERVERLLLGALHV